MVRGHPGRRRPPRRGAPEPSHRVDLGSLDGLGRAGRQNKPCFRATVATRAKLLHDIVAARTRNRAAVLACLHAALLTYCSFAASEPGAGPHSLTDERIQPIGLVYIH